MANNIVFNSIRLSMGNPQHVKINAVLSNLDNNTCKSKNQMIIDAIEFYIDHFGKEAFIPIPKEKKSKYITVDDLEKIKKELTESVMTEARREVIRLLATASVSKVASDSDQIIIVGEDSQQTVDDTVMTELVTSWMEDSLDEFEE